MENFSTSSANTQTPDTSLDEPPPRPPEQSTLDRDDALDALMLKHEVFSVVSSSRPEPGRRTDSQRYQDLTFDVLEQHDPHMERDQQLRYVYRYIRQHGHRVRSLFNEPEVPDHSLELAA